MAELKPCPFCGGEAHTYKNNLWHVACERAHNGCVTMSAFITEAEAVEAWNTRTPEQEISAALGGNENRISERLRSVASDMRNIGASSMTSHELFAYWAREVDKAADLAATLGGGECEIIYKGDLVWECQSCNEQMRITSDSPNFCPNCGKAVKR